MTRRVLIVDDSLTVRMDLAEAIEAAGFVPVPCATAAEAREALAREPVALVILDVLLPDADGVELLAELRAAPAASAPILMLSSEADVKDRIRGLQTGADDYVGKPYDLRYVVARVSELARGAHGDDGSVERATVLVIDDSPTFQEELRRALADAGYGVLTASDGAEGLRIAAAQRPAAIIVDGVMPGIDGPTVLRKIRLDVALRSTPCVLLTASEDWGAELCALDAGADAFVRKDEDLGVILARISAAIRSSDQRVEAAASLLGPKRILAVDDSITYLQELAGILRDEGYDVVLARSGEEALELLAVQSVDCILLDLLMPGLGGEETCRRIKTSPVVRDLPLILLSAVEDRQAMIDGLAAGADDYISKSSELEVVKARVRAQIRRKQVEDEHRRTREELLRSEREAAEARAARKLAETRAALAEELERKNKELEAFSYSVSHDLRAPLRSIDGFSQALVEDCAERLDEKGRGYLQRVRDNAQRMSGLIDDLLLLARVSRGELSRDRVNLSELALGVVDGLRRAHPGREVSIDVEAELFAEADARLVRVLFENLIGNAWKFTGKVSAPRIAFGCEEKEGRRRYFVRDNGAGFDMAYAHKLFAPFQRLHSEAEFTGTGIGLATVHRIVDRHGGTVCAEGELGQGAAIYFTLPAKSSRLSD